MGHLFSRVFKRFTQCGQSSSSCRNQQNERQQQSDTDEPQRQGTSGTRPSYVESIPVGQSIDSAEYAPFASREQTATSGGGDSAKRINVPEANISESHVDKQNDSPDESNKPQVEDAVIKIQAYVRGHLTRKALRGAQHQNVSPNALGQSQFDEESLTRNRVKISNKHPLGSIAEDAEIFHNSTSEGTPAEVGPTITSDNIVQGDDTTTADIPATTSNRRKCDNLQPFSQSFSRDRSVSPIPSESNVSIDLNCPSPASASIDISDHNIRPTDKMASILFHRPSPSPSPGPLDDPPSITRPHQIITRIDTPPPSPLESPQENCVDSPGSAEAAAIKIQSAFRGYHTRKHSPYRRRSPNECTPPVYPVDTSNCAIQDTNSKRNMLRQQDATVTDEIGDESTEAVLRNSTDTDSNADAAKAKETTQDRPSRARNYKQTTTDESEKVLTDQSSLNEKSAVSVDETTQSDASTTREAGPTRDQISAVTESQPLLVSVRDEDETDKFELRSSSHALDGVKAEQPGQSDANLEVDYSLNLRNHQHDASMTDAGVSFDLDTESSNLGAALSMSEDFPDTKPVSDQSTTKASGLETHIEEDKSLEANLVSENKSINAQQSVEHLKSVAQESASNQFKALDEAGLEEVESALEKEITEIDLGAALVSSLLDEDEQRDIELESDDIEKRDPSGAASEDRTKSPQPTDEQPVFVQESQQQQSPESSMQRENVQRLAVESLDEAIESGRSSPCLSAGNSSAEDDSDHEDATGGPKFDEHKTQQQQPKVTGSKSKKRNRNKRKGKK